VKPFSSCWESRQPKAVFPVPVAVLGRLLAPQLGTDRTPPQHNLLLFWGSCPQGPSSSASSQLPLASVRLTFSLHV
jgi:hypothetical protein